MQLVDRLTQIQKTEAALQHLSERVQGMILIGQDRDDLKTLTIMLVHSAKSLATLCGDRSLSSSDS